jgi:hypothetical protein
VKTLRDAGLGVLLSAMVLIGLVYFKAGHEVTACERELEQAERCVAMLERSELVNRQCLALLDARRELLQELDAGTY